MLEMGGVSNAKQIAFIVNALRTKLQSCSHGLVHLDGQWITVNKYRDMGLGEQDLWKMQYATFICLKACLALLLVLLRQWTTPTQHLFNLLLLCRK